MKLLSLFGLDSAILLSLLWSVKAQDGHLVQEPRIFVQDPAANVLPFIGTIRDGHVFPGATLPHGMIKAGMDTDSPGNHAGYDADPQYHVVGFSQLHDSGTGGGTPLSNFKIFPLGSAACTNFESCPTSRDARKVLRNVVDGKSDDAASPGYFSTNLTTGIRVELTATRRTALHRYTFPPNTPTPRILVDITNDGQVSGYNADVKLDPANSRLTGGALFLNSFGNGRYPAFTCVTFKGDGFNLGAPTEYGIWGYSGKPILGSTNSTQTGYGELGGIYTFRPAPRGSTAILARVGVSLVSEAQACRNAEEEIPDFDFARVHRENRQQWNDLLSRVQVDPTGVPKETVELFYSSLYRSHISPADYTGENPRWNSSEPYFDSLYCNWDTYRTLYPLMSLHDPVKFADIVRGMIDIQRHEGWLPECRGATLQEYIQGGSDADPILGEFYVKFHQHAKNLKVVEGDLLSALVADAEAQASNWDFQGRQIQTWRKFGYIPNDLYVPGGTNTRYVSRSLEYSFNDFSISQVAKLLNRTDLVERYRDSAGWFVNNWNPAVSAPDDAAVKGMMQVKTQNGSWVYTDPRHCSVNDPEHATCYLNAGNFDGFYESSPLVYSQYVPHDTAKLINLQGGVDAFKHRLDFIFEKGYFDSTNEPSQQIPFMYHYVNRPGLSTQTSRKVLAEFFNTTIYGLPGNDDSGAMASYVAFYLLGMYPLPATRQMLLSSPHFKEVSFFNPVYGTTTRIVAHGFEGNPVDGVGGKVFVKSVSVNGKRYKSNCYLEWEVFEQGSLVELELTDDINVTCGEGKEALPPSMSTGGYD